MSKKMLNVNLDDVAEAMEQGEDGMFGVSIAWYLDTETGKVKMIGGDPFGNRVELIQPI